MKINAKELREKAEKKDIENKEIWIKLLQSDEVLLDEDGYPTIHACELIRVWHWSDVDGWFNFIKKMWQHRNLTWQIQEEPHSWKENTLVKHLYVSTFGWSGNESIIKSMEENQMLWDTVWYQSNRGGHYIFEIPNDEDE